MAIASIAVAAAVVLAGCGRGGQQAQATSASPTAPAATAALSPGGAEASTSAAVQHAATGTASPRFAQVVAVQPITEPTTTSSPRRVCREEQVAVPETYKDKDQIGGAVVGGLIGALAGHQIGGGKGKTLATVGGAAAGAVAGHEIQKRHQEDNATTTATRNVCHKVVDKTSSTKTVGYDVTYILEGRQGHVRMDHDPGVGTGLPVRNGVVVAGAGRAGNYYR